LSIEHERAGSQQHSTQAAPAADEHQQAQEQTATPSSTTDCTEQPSTSGADNLDPGQGALQAEPANSPTAGPAAAAPDAEWQQPPAAAAGSLDIRDLSWVDRERVLRLLFAKINGKAAERRAAVLPAHPLDAAVAAAGAGTCC
jgi:hypothetical protein